WTIKMVLANRKGKSANRTRKLTNRSAETANRIRKPDNKTAHLKKKRQLMMHQNRPPASNKS
ncbi:hypothetical protein, partial [Bacillus sp. FJAT-27251]|uniref:hypothetical protein n=1 Tax=Bacillus sp. FJAT-27251 TaxID=1684142 RepID=UPI0006A7DB85